MDSLLRSVGRRLHSSVSAGTLCITDVGSTATSKEERTAAGEDSRHWPDNRDSSHREVILEGGCYRSKAWTRRPSHSDNECTIRLSGLYPFFCCTIFVISYLQALRVLKLFTLLIPICIRSFVSLSSIDCFRRSCPGLHSSVIL